MKEILLSHNKKTQVDDDDYEELIKVNWFAYRIAGTSHTGKVYLYGYKAGRKVQGKKYWIHNIIMKPSEGLVVDHIDGDPLNNQKSNLRVCTKKENSFNRGKRCSGKTSKFLGVSRDKKKFVAKIKLDGKTRHIGSFSSEIDAAKVYDEMAKKLFGKFARLNFPDLTIADT